MANTCRNLTSSRYHMPHFIPCSQNPVRQGLLFSDLTDEKTEVRSCHLPAITQLVNGRVGIRTQAVSDIALNHENVQPFTASSQPGEGGRTEGEWRLAAAPVEGGFCPNPS